MHSTVVWNQVSHKDFHCIIFEDNLGRSLARRALDCFIYISYPKKRQDSRYSSSVYIGLTEIYSTQLPEFNRLRKNRLWSANLCLNLKFGQPIMSKFKSGLGSVLDIRVQVVWIFESFRVRTIGQPGSDIRQLCLCVILIQILYKIL